MSEHFLFENLTWPEVATLDRDTPLILPLGEGYSIEKVSTALGNPDKIGWLPAIPYGWKGSQVGVGEDILAACLENLTGSMKEDGFQKVVILLPRGIEFRPSGETLIAEAEGSHVSMMFKSEDLEKVVLIPIGQTEQHGYHLPLNVDTVCIKAIMEGTGAAIPGKAICLPVFPYGVSTHRSSFAGTFNMRGRIFEDFFLAVVDRLNDFGFKLIYLNSGHGGNVSFLVNVIKYAGERHPDGFCATTWLYLNGPEGARSLENHRQSAIGGMGHACELETSLMLYLRPELVHMERVVDETDFISTPSYVMDWNESGALAANPPWLDDTFSGAYGAGSLGTAEKGAIWLQDAIHEKIDHVDEIIFQHTQRTLKKQGRLNPREGGPVDE
jgi:creatinine amidohydrolase